MSKGTLIAKGRTAEVYSWGDSQVLKLFYNWCPAEWVEREARVAEVISGTAVPSPRFFGRVRADGREGIIFERVQGVSLLRQMMENPLRLGEYARLMANLHSLIRAQSAATLPHLRDWLRKSILAVDFDRRLKQASLERLEKLPDGTQLCHFDFHPDQIMITEDGPKVLDWMTAFQGDGQADVARTLLLLTAGNVSHLGLMTRIVVGTGRRHMKRAYLKETIRLDPKLDMRVIRSWMLPIAAARLNERIAAEEQTLLRFLAQETRKLGV
jgi:aminoglycoside phosphotransferase (APT) family kinase protein